MLPTTMSINVQYHHHNNNNITFPHVLVRAWSFDTKQQEPRRIFAVYLSINCPSAMNRLFPGTLKRVRRDMNSLSYPILSYHLSPPPSPSSSSRMSRLFLAFHGADSLPALEQQKSPSLFWGHKVVYRPIASILLSLDSISSTTATPPNSHYRVHSFLNSEFIPPAQHLEVRYT